MSGPDIHALEREIRELRHREKVTAEAVRLCSLFPRTTLTRSDRDLIAEGVQG